MTLEIELPGRAPETSDLLAFFESVLSEIVDLFETQLAFLAEYAIEKEGGFQIVLLQLRPEDRRNNVTYSFGVVLDGKVMPIS